MADNDEKEEYYLLTGKRKLTKLEYNDEKLIDFFLNKKKLDVNLDLKFIMNGGDKKVLFYSYDYNNDNIECYNIKDKDSIKNIIKDSYEKKYIVKLSKIKSCINENKDIDVFNLMKCINNSENDIINDDNKDLQKFYIIIKETSQTSEETPNKKYEIIYNDNNDNNDNKELEKIITNIKDDKIIFKEKIEFFKDIYFPEGVENQEEAKGGSKKRRKSNKNKTYRKSKSTK